jgi:hypothetical protein
VFWLLSSHLAIIVLTLNKFFVWLKFWSFTGSPIDPPSRSSHYFTIYQVPEALWANLASMHMEGNAAMWLQVYKMRQGLGKWMQFGKVVRAKFGMEEYPKVMRHLLNLYQMKGVE